MLNKQDFKSILNLYNLGKLKSYKQIVREENSNIEYNLQNIFVFTTDKGKFFLKQYHRINYHIRKGFSLIKFLLKKRYPCVKVIYSNKNKPFVYYKGKPLAIFEFIEFKDNEVPTEKRFFELGRYLGKLHNLTKNFPIRKNPSQSYESLYDSLKKNYYKLKNTPNRIQKVYEYVKINIPSVKVPRNLPKSVCHYEFTLEHVKFRNNKLIKVIDWDLVGKDYMFYDLGTAMVSTFYKDKINFKFMANLIKGYSEERKLTSWERNHILESLQFGVFKFFIWNLDSVKRWKWHVDYARVEYLMNYSKTKFIDRLANCNVL